MMQNRFLFLLAGALGAGLALIGPKTPPGRSAPALADEIPAAPAFEKHVDLAYSINTFGYTDVCG